MIDEISQKFTTNHLHNQIKYALLVFLREPGPNNRLPLPILLKLESSNRGRKQTLKIYPGKRIPNALLQVRQACEKPMVYSDSSRSIHSVCPSLGLELVRTSAP